MERTGKSVLDDVLGLSMEEKAQLFADWMMAETDRKLKKTFFVEWMKAERNDRKFLKDIADKAAATYVTEGFAGRDYAEIERWLERAVENNKGLTTDKMAHACKNYFSLREKMVPMLMKVIRRKKQNKLVRESYRRKARVDSTGRGRSTPTAFKRLLAEGTYSLNLPLAETARTIHARRGVAQSTLPGILDDPPSLGSSKRIEDYEALITPYRPLLAEVSSLEVLDELLRILYEEGDVPSVVSWPGKTSDSEYMNLREYKQFLEILQGISLYDHTYNVLKASLDISRNSLRQRHDLLLPSVITAAVAHDIGKIPTLWRFSNVRNRGHESMGAARLQDMLTSGCNDTFKESVVKAVRLHHSGANDNDTVARIIMDADARAREYEIRSVDPAFTISPMTAWLDLARLAEIILPAINKLVIRNRKAVWKAMSVGGVVYCMPGYVRSALKTLAFEKKVLDYRLLRQSFKSDNRAVLNEFSAVLRENGLLAHDIKDGNFGLRFLFQSSIPGTSCQSLYAIPIKGELFPVKSSELQKRKTDYLKTIVSVRPAAGGY